MLYYTGLKNHYILTNTRINEVYDLQLKMVCQHKNLLISEKYYVQITFDRDIC